MFAKLSVRGGAFLNEAVLPGLECVLPHNAKILDARPPTFVLGAPRCGSTLLIQLLSSNLEISYLSNRHARFYGCPALVERFAPPSADRNRAHMSDHGRTQGPAGPAECGQWWYRFFPQKPAYVERGGLGPRARESFIRSLAALAAASSQPFVFKNLYASLRIHEIASAVPMAKFIVLSRDTVDQAHSVLEGRRKVNGDFGRWWSMRPPSPESLEELRPAQQVVEQILQTHRVIDNDLSASEVPESQIMRLHYEDLCSDPAASIKTVGDFIGASVRTDAISRLPQKFERRREVRIPADLYQDVKDLVGRA